jgi:hypothetical protein
MDVGARAGHGRDLHRPVVALQGAGGHRLVDAGRGDADHGRARAVRLWRAAMLSAAALATSPIALAGFLLQEMAFVSASRC